MKKEILLCDIQNATINIEAECTFCGEGIISFIIDTDNNIITLKCDNCSAEEEITF